MYLIFDTETTDLVHNSLRPLGKQPKLIEFFGLRLNRDMEEIGAIQQLINPGIPIPEEITKITSITNDMVKEAPMVHEVISDLVKIIENNDTVVAHNLSYDMSIMNFEGLRCGWQIKWPKHLVCTVEATEWMKGHRLKLASLYEELFGETFENAHRAENDVRATARIFVELVKRGEI
jgi:DNA polymerase-3 subunit alpha (Gram-positive type)